MALFLKQTVSGHMVPAEDGEYDAELAEVRLSAQEYFELQTHINEMEQMVSDLREALEQQEDLNENLKRIARERANAKRDLKPKKERCGYLVLYSAQYKEHYRDENGEKCVGDTWRSALQTPYDASIPLETVQNEIWNDLLHEVLFQLGFRMVQATEYNGTYRKWTSDDGSLELCGLYRWDYKANYKSGFWEMSLYHTKNLTVPEDFRPTHA